MHGRSILIVDDEPQIGQLIEQTLQTHQYSVSWAKTAEEALIVWRQEPGRFRLALINISHKPGRNSGFKLAAELKTDSPHAFFIFMSDYTAEHYPAEHLVQGINFLEKPFHIQQLLDIVNLHCPKHGEL